MRLDAYNSWLDDLGVSQDHPIRETANELVDYVYESDSVNGNPRSIEAAALYTAVLIEGTGNLNVESHHYTQNEFAEVCGISEGTLNRKYRQIIQAKGWDS